MRNISGRFVSLKSEIWTLLRSRYLIYTSDVFILILKMASNFIRYKSNNNSINLINFTGHGSNANFRGNFQKCVNIGGHELSDINFLNFREMYCTFPT